MTEIRSFAEAQAALRQFYSKHTVYTLDTMRKLMHSLGRPQDAFTAVHIAGTSGKTSTSYYTAALLTASGAKVGLTVSPHVDELNERVQINMVPLPEAKFCRELTAFLELVAESGVEPSYFECLVAFAYWEFARQQVDYAVIEVGLGGLLDGTNVINREDKVCIITDIGLDHTQVLGDTIGKIAQQKAGIIQTGNTIFMYEQAPEVMQAIADRQAEVGPTDLRIVPAASAPILQNSTLPLFQQRNINLAEAAANFTLSRDKRSPLSQQQIQQASETYIPGRMEQVNVGDKTIIIDGSHNAQKLQTLFKSVDHEFPGVPRAAVIGFVDGDSIRLRQALEVLKTELTHAIVTSFYTERDAPKQSVPAEVVVGEARTIGWADIEVEADPRAALRQLLERPEPVLLVTGSFYLLSHIRPLLEELQA